MQAFWLPFVVLPSVGGTLAGWAAVDWRLAIALIAGSLAILVLPSAPGAAALTLARPLASGVAIGAIAVLPALLRGKRPSVWTRLTLGLATAFVVHLLYLSTIGPI